MKEKLFSPYRAILAVTALIWCMTPVFGAETPSRPTVAAAQGIPSDSSLKWILPSPQMMGSQWVWPWQAPNNQAKISGDNWKTQFWAPQDPRPMLTKKWIDLESISEADYQKNSAAHARAMQLLGAKQPPLTLEQMIEELQIQVSAVTDFAYVSYHQLPDQSASSSGPETDFLSLKLTSFSEDYIEERKRFFEMGDGALASAFAATRQTRSQVHKVREEKNALLLQDYEKALLDAYTFKKGLDEMKNNGLPAKVVANAKRQVKGKEEAVEKAGIKLDRAIGNLGEVEGATLRGADGGFMVWSIEKTSGSKSLRIGGKLRHQNIVLEFGRSISGSFEKQAALNDTVGILTMLSGRIAKHLSRPDLQTREIALNFKPDMQVAFNSQYTKPTDPAALLNGNGELPSFIAATSSKPLEAAGPRRIPPAEVAERFTKIAPPPLPASFDNDALKKLRAEANQAYAANELEEALTLYRRLAAVQPNNLEVQIAMGRTCNYLDDRTGAISAYTKVYELAPETPFVRTWLAELYLATGERTRAVHWLGEELKTNPESAWAHSWLASTHLEIGDPTTANVSFQKAMAIDSKVASYRLQNGTALQARGLYRRALTEFAAATYLDPSSQQAYLGVAACYAALQERESAVQWYERYLQINPRGEGAAVARKALLQLSQTK